MALINNTPTNDMNNGLRLIHASKRGPKDVDMYIIV